MSIFDKIIAKLSGVPNKEYLDEIPRVYHDGKMITEEEYFLIKQEDIKREHIREREERIRKREENIAAIKRRFENYEEILAVIDKLTEKEKDREMEFLLSLRKKHRDEFDWETHKNELLQKKACFKKK